MKSKTLLITMLSISVLLLGVSLTCDLFAACNGELASTYDLSVTIGSPTEYVKVGENQTFTVTHNAPNSDSMAYEWTGTDGKSGTDASVTWSWATPGEKTIILSASSSGTFDGDLATGDCDDFDEATVTILKVDLTTTKGHGLWWFDGQNSAYYDEEGTLTAQGATTGTFQWDVVAGSSIVDLNNGGADADSITAADDNTVTIKSTGASTPPGDDVAIRLTYNGVPVCEQKLSVFAPTSTQASPSNPTRNEYDEIMYGITPYGWDVWYRFTTLDQFGDPLPDGIEINEQFGAFVSDYAGENWSPLAAAGATNPTAIFEDLYRILGPRPMLEPNPALLAHTGYFKKVFHVDQKYYAGSSTPGNGRLIKTHNVQFYRGFAEQY